MKNIIYFNSKSGFLILGVIWILLGVFWLINNGFKSWLGYGYLLIGIAWLFSSGKRKEEYSRIAET